MADTASAPYGVCNCTDCGGNDNTTTCFWDSHPFRLSRAQRTGSGSSNIGPVAFSRRRGSGGKASKGSAQSGIAGKPVSSEQQQGKQAKARRSSSGRRLPSADGQEKRRGSWGRRPGSTSNTSSGKAADKKLANLKEPITPPSATQASGDKAVPPPTWASITASSYSRSGDVDGDASDGDGASSDSAMTGSNAANDDSSLSVVVSDTENLSGAEYFSAKEQADSDDQSEVKSKQNYLVQSLKGLHKSIQKRRSKGSSADGADPSGPGPGYAETASDRPHNAGSKKKTLKKKKMTKAAGGEAVSPHSESVEALLQERDELRAEVARLQQQGVAGEHGAAEVVALRQEKENLIGQARQMSLHIHELEENGAKLDEELSAIHHRIRDHQKQTATLLSSLSLSLGRLPHSMPLCATDVPTRWQGSGSPYLLHLSAVAHTLQPYLVQLLQNRSQEAGKRVLLVGAAAWNAYTFSPLNTEDLDFIIDLDNKALHSMMKIILDEALDFPLINDMLHRLQAVGAVPFSNTDDPAARDKLKKELAVAENRDYSSFPPTTVASLLRLSRSDAGFRVQVGHKTLIDVCSMTDRDKNYLTADNTVPLLQLSQLLPCRLVHRYNQPINPVIEVAPIPLLQGHLQASLSTTVSWRLQKDVSRLRMLSQEATIQMLTEDGPLAQYLSEWDCLLAQFDPGWMAAMLQLRRILEVALRFVDGELSGGPHSGGSTTARSSGEEDDMSEGSMPLPSSVGMNRIRRLSSRNSIDSISLSSLVLSDKRYVGSTHGQADASSEAGADGQSSSSSSTTASRQKPPPQDKSRSNQQQQQQSSQARDKHQAQTEGSPPKRLNRRNTAPPGTSLRSAKASPRLTAQAPPASSAYMAGPNGMRHPNGYVAAGPMPGYNGPVFMVPYGMQGGMPGAATSRQGMYVAIPNGAYPTTSMPGHSGASYASEAASPAPRMRRSDSTSSVNSVASNHSNADPRSWQRIPGGGYPMPMAYSYGNPMQGQYVPVSMAVSHAGPGMYYVQGQGLLQQGQVQAMAGYGANGPGTIKPGPEPGDGAVGRAGTSTPTAAMQDPPGPHGVPVQLSHQQQNGGAHASFGPSSTV